MKALLFVVKKIHLYETMLHGILNILHAKLKRFNHILFGFLMIFFIFKNILQHNEFNDLKRKLSVPIYHLHKKLCFSKKVLKKKSKKHARYIRKKSIYNDLTQKPWDLNQILQSPYVGAVILKISAGNDSLSFSLYSKKIISYVNNQTVIGNRLMVDG